MNYKPLPIGVDSFEDIIKNRYYYVDKTLFIKDLIDLKGKVNLFTRPRRFGKSLNMSMLRYFFENTGNAEKNKKLKDMSNLYKALIEGDEKTFSEIISNELMNSISYNDYLESFYHGILIGMFNRMENYTVISNLESGLGRPDILIRPRTVRKEAIILEIKRVKDIEDLETACVKALKQIEINKYEEGIRRDGFRKFIKYGVTFYKKECLLKSSSCVLLIYNLRNW